jgi:hypothetical protein
VIDVRGPRFAAWLTTAVLIAAVFISSLSTTAAAWVVGGQSVVFAAGALLGIRRSPYSLLFRYAVAPLIGKPRQFEDERPPRFAQAVGLVFGLVATIEFAFGSAAVGLTVASLALAAAFLNAAFGFCLGCEMYLLIRTRLGGPVSTPAH